MQYNTDRESEGNRGLSLNVVQTFINRIQRRLFHVTTRHEHAENVSIKATIALKQTVRYQLVDET